MRQQSSSGRVGRHRQERLHRHRAPAFPALLAGHGRTALSVTALSASIAAGIGVAGVAASAAPTLAGGPPAHVTASHPYVQAPVAAPPGDEAPGKQFPHGLGVADEPAHPAGVAVQRKKRPVVAAVSATSAGTGAPGRVRTSSATRVQPAARWVHPMPSAGVTSCFGQRWGRLHAGVDLAAPHGTPIVAVGAGVVVAAGPAGGYGNAVLIQHADGYLTHYGHMSEILVETGHRVAAGERIGREGSTGHSTGPHLHFEVHQGHYKNPIEPTAWLRARGITIAGCTTIGGAAHDH
ncbi:M23 family metallopeptidase [Actinoplanes sp. DH11]|uniref:M23 family metallopeptidase n=1 Tax=Actinoplanes sp. DH11 TaxID=2857011 RepID=UPI001E2B6A3B|nr:M23 family metallopeptidase [Actinoplanes sp. DH11]